MRSTTLQLYPYSLSYHDTSFTKLLFKEIPAFASKILLWKSPIKSLYTTSSSV
ncbi:hypothetical protein X975_13410, partial [Stegodyphus mimosarum]